MDRIYNAIDKFIRTGDDSYIIEIADLLQDIHKNQKHNDMLMMVGILYNGTTNYTISIRGNRFSIAFYNRETMSIATNDMGSVYVRDGQLDALSMEPYKFIREERTIMNDDEVRYQSYGCEDVVVTASRTGFELRGQDGKITLHDVNNPPVSFDYDREIHYVCAAIFDENVRSLQQSILKQEDVSSIDNKIVDDTRDKDEVTSNEEQKRGDPIFENTSIL